MKVFLFSIYFLLALSCQRFALVRPAEFNLADKAKATIVNGEMVLAPDTISSHVAIISTVDQSGSAQVCSGVFIAKNKIATAGHCIADDLAQMAVSFRLYRQNAQTSATDLPILNVVRVEKNEVQGRQDLAIIEVKAPAELNAVPVDILQTQIPDSRQILIIGYGVTNPHAADSETLRKRTILIKNIDHTKNTFEVDQNQNNGGVCFGDSGAPALYFDQATKKYYLVGIASAVTKGENKNVCLNKAIFMNVPFYQNEIGELL